MRKKLLILDLDGTLVDSLADLAAATNHVRHLFGLPPLLSDDVRRLIGRGARDLVTRALPDAGPGQVDIGLAAFIAFNERHLLENTVLYPGVRETVEELAAAGRSLAVISNKQTDLCRVMLGAFGIAPLFAAIHGADAFPERKPSPMPVLRMLEQFAVTPDAAVVVGDSINDMAAGAGAGVATVGCTYGYGDPEELATADWLIDEFAGLLSVPI